MSVDLPSSRSIEIEMRLMRRASILRVGFGIAALCAIHLTGFKQAGIDVPSVGQKKGNICPAHSMFAVYNPNAELPYLLRFPGISTQPQPIRDVAEMSIN
jgi:hypothetical protein